MSDEARRAHARDRLAALRNGFVERLRTRVGELERAVEGARAGDDGGVERTEQLAHKLAGTAGSYGFQEVGDVAAQLETLCGGRFDPETARVLMDRLRALVPGS